MIGLHEDNSKRSGTVHGKYMKSNHFGVILQITIACTFSLETATMQSSNKVVGLALDHARTLIV